MHTTPEVFADAVRRYGNRPALVDEQGRATTYSELDAIRKRAAGALIARGIQPGDRVAIWAPNTVQWVMAALAIHSAGAALVPINTRMRGKEAGYILARSGARLMFCAGDFLGTHYPGLLGDDRPDTLEDIVILHDARASDTGWDAFLDQAPWAHETEVKTRAASVTADSVMDIMFTSGTTGLPKGVVTCHGQNLRVIAEWSRCMGLKADDRYLVVNPFFHAFGYKVGWLAGLMHGMAVYPQAVFDAATVMERIGRDRISVLPGPPTLFVSLLDDPDRASRDLSSLRATITGAAAVAPSLIERIRAELGFEIVLTGYGLTETCGIVTLCDADDDAETIVNTVGRALPAIDLRCMDDTGKLLGPNETGEVVVRGYNVMQGYLDDATATHKAIDAAGWLHTGDIGSIDDNGYLKITDRLKDMYICGGFNCYPAEIERLVAAHPAVSQVAVVGVPDARMGEVGKAYVVPRSGQQLDEAAFREWCRDRMANYKVPRHLELRESLPTNASGKVLKYELRGKES
ncbi:FadD3 family acyl-CoA ligase [Algiphilus sp.]|uniref:FadD3 family acyl-CoA ligase n=1 Tax=Algiphilus sp. TaxID=1872431 RepID=UPI0025BB6CC0|nr:FadD3 family acyl-CoA ligase [Algiphilus sp.]MCK5769674.1 FadD3 family acyl-CoA ligase [Algiphilus sp.]